jgi:hypothetical protein
MSMRIILPKAFVAVDGMDAPLFFLAGPCRGGGRWHPHVAVNIGHRFEHRDYFVVIPDWYDANHWIRNHAVKGAEDRFPRQLSWERYYLERAADRKLVRLGHVIFWLPCESKTEPRDDGSPYARDTYGELGEWRGRLMSDPHLRVVIGAEDGFPGLSQIKRNFDEATGKDFPIYSTLDDTIKAAVDNL